MYKVQSGNRTLIECNTLEEAIKYKSFVENLVNSLSCATDNMIANVSMPRVAILNTDTGQYESEPDDLSISEVFKLFREVYKDIKI